MTEQAPKLSSVVEDFNFLHTVDTASPVLHLGVSASNLVLSVCVVMNGVLVALLYDMRAFFDQVEDPQIYPVLHGILKYTLYCKY